MHILNKSIIAGMSLLLLACKNVVPYSIALPPPPPILKVDVLNNCACGEDLMNLQENWLNVWLYVEQLQTLGNFKLSEEKQLIYKCKNGRFKLNYIPK